MVDDVTTLSMDELRAKRAESQAIETGLSYLRRLAQGRLDIVAAEQPLGRAEDVGEDAHACPLPPFAWW